MISRFTLILFLFQMACLGLGQNSPKQIVFGSKLIDGSIIMDYTNKWKVTHVNADGVETPNRIWTDYGQVIELDGKKYFHRVQDLYDPKMSLQETWINMVEIPSLKPISFSRFTPTGNFSFTEFNESMLKSISNFQSESMEIIEKKYELEESIYDWNLYGILLIGLPFEKGVSFEIPIYSAQAEQLVKLIATVDGKEEIKISDGRSLTTWKISTDKNLTFWLTKEAPFVHQLELQLPNKSKLIWKTF